MASFQNAYLGGLTYTYNNSSFTKGFSLSAIISIFRSLNLQTISSLPELGICTSEKTEYVRSAALLISGEKKGTILTAISFSFQNLNSGLI